MLNEIRYFLPCFWDTCAIKDADLKFYNLGLTLRLIMPTSNNEHQMILEDTQKMDKQLRFLERLCKFTLMIFRSNDEKPKISIFFFLLAISLLLLSELVSFKSSIYNF